MPMSMATYPGAMGRVELAPEVGSGELEALYDLAEPEIDPATGEPIDAGDDPLGLIEALLAGDDRADLSSRSDSLLPGPSLAIALSPEARTSLARELCDLLDEYDTAMRDRRQRVQEVRDNYAMSAGSSSRDGAMSSLPDSTDGRSEVTMEFVDQAAARVTTGVMGVTPLMRCDAVQQSGFDGAHALDMAASTEVFLHEYGMNGPPDLRHTLPTALLEACKTGNPVLYVEWKDKTCRRRYYSADSPDLQVKSYTEGRLEVVLLDELDVVIWPPTHVNWQKATFVGHQRRHSPEEWRAVAARYGITDEDRAAVDRNPNDGTLEADAADRREGINPGNLNDRPELEPRALFELWCEMTLPEETEPRAFQVILHRPSQTLCYIGENPYFYETKPYFPIRYKWGRGAWADGVGQEIIWGHAADAGMWALEQDNLMAGAYWITLRTAGSVYDTQSNDPRPGMQLVVDDVDKDFKTLKLGGEAPEIQLTRNNNYMRMRAASGLSAVLSGQGDPVMKSGAGTGSVLALIEQGDKKLRNVDANLRTDLSDFYMFLLQVVAQYAPDGLFYRYTSEEDGDNLRLLKYTPPRGDIAQMFRLRAQAPSIGTSDDARKQNLIIVAGQAQMQLAAIDAQVTPYLEANNPAAIPRWKYDLAAYQLMIHQQIVKLHEIPRVSESVPKIPDMTEADETINGLNEQLADLQSQLEGLQGQRAQLQNPQAQAQAPAPEGQAGMTGAPGMPDPNQGAAPAPDPMAAMMGGMPGGMVS